jgi:6-phosphofructokinase 1
MSIKRIAVNTGGGDAPGLNAVIRAIVLSALNLGWECFGIRDGYDGLLAPEKHPQGGLIRLTRDCVRGITHLGGTILGTTSRGNPLRYPVVDKNGRLVETDRTDELLARFKAEGLDGLIAIGGDGSMEIAHVLYKKGLKVIGVPKTIDNDLDKTVITFGFDTAVHFATECCDRLHSTAEAHQRIMVVEVMGRYAGWIALNVGVSSTADVILIPEIPYDIHRVAEKVRDREKSGRFFSIIVVAEGARPKKGSRTVAVKKTAGQAEKLGGIGQKICLELEEITGKEARQGQAGVMVALDPPTVNYVPLEQACQRMKTVPLDCDTILTARDLGISFGD